MILLYVLLALSLSVWSLQSQNFIGYDGIFYARMAESMMAGKGIWVNPGEPYLDHPPFYPLLMGIANLFFRDIEFSGHLVSILAFSLTLLPLFFLTQGIYGEKTAHWASLLFATHGFLVIHSNLVLAESLLILLVMIELYFVHKVIQGEGRYFSGILAGTAAGMAYLTRPEGFLFYGAGALGILLFSQKPLRFRIRVVLVSLIPFLIFLMPYVGFIYRNTHQFQTSRLVSWHIIQRQMDYAHPGRFMEVKKVYEGLTSDKKRIKLDELMEEFDLFEYLKKDNFVLLRSVPSFPIFRFLDFSKYLYGGSALFLIGAAFLAVPWDERRKRSELLFLLFLATFLSQAFSVFIPKRYLPYLPFFLIWTGHGIEVLRNWAKKSFNLSQKVSLALGLGTCLALALPSVGYLHSTRVRVPMPFEYKELGLWMKKNIPDSEKESVASRHPSVNFYSGTKLLSFPYLPYVDEIEDLLTYLAYHRTRYFVVGEDLDRPALDTYRFLLDETQPPPPNLLRRHIVRQKHKVILYEVESPPWQ